MNIVLEELNESHDYVQFCTLLKQLTSINLDNFTKHQFNNQLSIINSNPYHKIVVAIADNKIIGTITVLIEPKIIHDLSRVAHIEDVVVDSNYRMHGVGKLLVNKAIEISKDLGCYKIILDCSSKNVDFYKKNGFSVKESQMALYLD